MCLTRGGSLAGPVPLLERLLVPPTDALDQLVGPTVKLVSPTVSLLDASS